MRATVLGRTLGLAVLVLAIASTGGCIRFGAKPPARLLGIASEAHLATGTPMTSVAKEAIFIEVPNVPRSIDTQRVAVRDKDNSYAYVPKALWVDTPAKQFQSLLSETVSARSGRLVLDPGQYPSQVGQVLHGELIEFGVDARKNEAVVTFDATLLSGDGLTVRHQRFSATRPLSDINADTVAPAINRSANEVAAAVADWVKTVQ